MFGQSLLSAFGIACTTDTDQLFGTDVTATSTATYQLNNATTSIPSNTYPGTANNITYTSGKFGNAAVFNGSNADIDISSSAINTTSPYTISMWLNIVDVTQYEGIFANVTSSYLTNQIAFVLNNGKISIYSVVSNGNTTLDAITATPQSAIANNTWFNLVIVADRSLANKAKVFFNGVEASYAFVSGGAGTSAYSNIKVGLADGANRYFTGSIDQIRFFNSSLPQSAVTALYNETTTTATSASIDYVDANPNSIAYYKMSNATDQLGNYNGTASNVNFNTEGKFGFAGAFNGSSSSILLPNDILSSDFSISTWFYLNNTSGDQLLFEFDHENRVMFRVASTDSNKAYIGNSGYFDPGISFSANQWYHFVLTFSNGNPFKIYVNNVLSYTGGNTNTNAFNNDNIFGAANVSGSGSINGKIDQVRIYDSAISAADVTTLYKEVECPPLIVDFLVVAGGGGGGAAPATNIGAGGGGAGGYRNSFNSEDSGGGGASENSLQLSLGTLYSIEVGSGGAGAASNAFGIAGGNSIFNSITSIGGGGGANYDAAGSTGGSGGGSYILVSGGIGNNPGLGTNTTNGDATNQGFNGGTVENGSSSGGGGGAGSVGLNSANTGATQTGNGGNGLESEISGSAVTRAGGGGGGRYSVEAGGPGTGGTGGGGAGGNQSNGADASPANSGSGGGGGADGYSGGSGSSGIVILRYVTSKVSSFAVTGTLNTPTPSIVGTDSVLIFTTGTGTIKFS